MKATWWMMFLTGLVGAAAPSEAATMRAHGCPCPACAPVVSDCAPCPEVQYVEREIQVPTMVTEMRTVTCTRYRDEQREYAYTTYKRVPRTETVNETYTVMVPQQRTRTVSYRVAKPVMSTRTVSYTVCVPTRETRQGTRTIAKCVPVVRTRTVCVDEGSWQQRTYTVCDPCGGCGSCGGCAPCVQTRTCNVWVPNVVRKQVEYTAYQMVREPQTYQYTVTVMKPRTMTKNVQECRMTYETQSREETYTVCVPTQQTRSHQVTHYDCVAVPMKRTCTVRVPYQAEMQVPVRVCRMVTKKVTVAVGGGCSPCYSCN